MRKIDSFKNRLAKALSNKQMKAITLSEIIHINKSSISQWLSGVNKPNGENLINIAKALNVSEIWLLGYDVPMNNEETISKEEIVVNEEQSYQIYTKNGTTKFYINGSEVENVKKVKIEYDVELGKPKVIFEINGATSTMISVATVDKYKKLGRI